VTERAWTLCFHASRPPVANRGVCVVRAARLSACGDGERADIKHVCFPGVGSAFGDQRAGLPSWSLPACAPPGVGVRKLCASFDF
jgi:hypothetical protein